MNVKPHATFAEDENGKRTQQIAWIEPARPSDVEKLTTSGQHSGWFWMRLQNGDLLLGIFPQEDTYLEFSDDGVCDWQDAEAAS